MFCSALLSLLTAPALVQQPAAPPQAVRPMVERMPADSILVAEFSLEPWDRLRRSTRAHKIVSDQNLLKTGLSEWFDNEALVRAARTALGAIRVTIAVDAEALENGWALLAIEPVSVGAAGYPWEPRLRQWFGLKPRQVDRVWLTVLRDPSVPDQEEAGAFLTEAVRAIRQGENALGDAPRWRTLQAGVPRGEDLLRLSLVSWNLGALFAPEEPPVQIMRPAPPPPEIVDDEPAPAPAVVPPAEPGEDPRPAGKPQQPEPAFEAEPWPESAPQEPAADPILAVLEKLGWGQGMLWVTSIDGGTFLDQVFLPRSEGAPLFVSLGAAGSAVDGLGTRATGEAYVQLMGLDGVALAQAVREIAATVPSDGEPLTQAFTRSMAACLEQLGPEMLGWTPMSVYEEGGTMGNITAQVRDRAALESAWQGFPEELRAMMPLILSQLGSSDQPVQLSETELHFTPTGADSGGERLDTLPDWGGVRAGMLEALAGREPVYLLFQPAAMDQLWLAPDSAILSTLRAEFGTDFGLGSLRPDRLKHLRAAWAVGFRADDGLHLAGRSTFGILPSQMLAGIASELLGPAETEEAFDAEEF